MIGKLSGATGELEVVASSRGEMELVPKGIDILVLCSMISAHCTSQVSNYGKIIQPYCQTRKDMI